MQQATELFCAALEEVPRDPSDLHNDPSPLVLLVEAATALVDLPPDDWNHNDEELRACRIRVWTALAMVDSETLSAQNYAPHAKQSPAVCLGELCFMAALRLTWLHTTQRLDQGSIATLPFCARHRLSCADASRPIIDYSVSELIACVQAMRTGFTQLPFHSNLVELVELCEMTCARLVFETGTRDIFDLPLAPIGPCCEVASGEYATTGEFYSMMWPSFVGFHRRLLVRRLLPTNVDNPPVDHEAMRRLCDWIQRKSKEVVYQDASPSLKRYYVRMHLRPGDREIHQMQRPGVTTSEPGVVSETLADARMAQINPRTNMSPADCIAKMLPEWSYHAQPEPMELGFCLYDFLEMVTQGSPGCSWNAYYARPELAVSADEVQRLTRERPMVVQLFSHWQVVYANKVYWFNSAVASITFWLFLMARVQSGDAHTESAEFHTAAQNSLYRELVDVVVHNNRDAQADAVLPRDTASMVYLPVTRNESR